MPSAPKAPDPYATAAAQAQANKDAVYDSARVNQFSQVDPYGSQKWTGDIGSADRTLTTTLSKDEQAKYDLMNRAIQGAGAHVENRLGQITDTPFTLDGAPQRQFGGMTTSYDQGPGLKYGIDDAGQIQRNVQGAGPIQRQFGDAGQIQTQVGPEDVNASLKSAQDAVYGQATSRLDPQFAKRQTDLETQLTNQGITQTSNPAAWQQAMDQFARDKNDAYTSASNAATTTGIGLQGQLFGQDVTKGSFANTAQGQQFGQLQDRATFGNTAQAQKYGQNANNMTATNAAQGQQFGQNAAQAQMYNDSALATGDRNLQGATFTNNATTQNQNSQNAGRDAYINELLMTRQQPLNELSALLSGTSVNTPQFGSPAQYQMAAPDIGGYIQQNYATQMSGRNAMLGAITGAVGGLGGAAIGKYCWVAREVYGAANPRWLKIREWMLTTAPAALRDFYGQYGEQIADFISDKPAWKARIRMAMDDIAVPA